MNKLLVSMIGSGLLAATAAATPITVSDDYVGGTGGWGDNNNHSSPSSSLLKGDVIGDANIFGVDSMTITQNESYFNFDIKTNFAGKQGTYYGDYIGYGDLFLGNSWTPNGSSSDGFASDEAFSSVWTYALVLDNKAGGSGDLLLYKMYENSTSTVLLSNDFMEPTANGYRKNQEVALNLGAEDSGLIYNTQTVGSWTEDLANNLLKMEIDLTGTGLLDSNTLAFHWTMYCANDVIQGQADITPVSVPEPGLLSLLGVGIAGLWFARRRQQKKVA